MNDGGRKDIDEDYLESTYSAKTGELFVASIAGPALLLDRNDDIELLKGYGKSIGMAFQIVDDILGVVSTKEELGKSPNKDKDNDKITYLDVMGMKGARDRAKIEIERAKEMMFAYGELAEPFVMLADFIISRTF